MSVFRRRSSLFFGLFSTAFGCTTTPSAIFDGGTDARTVIVSPDAAPCVVTSTFRGSGFFRVEPDNCRRWSLIDPDGRRFYSRGVNQVSFEADEDPDTRTRPYMANALARHGSREAWAATTRERLAAWKFNTIGAWSSVDDFAETTPYTVILDLAQVNWAAGEIPDYFSNEWAASVERRVAERVTPRRDHRNLIGWFLDNEMHWGLDVRGGVLFDQYMTRPATNATKTALVDLLERRHDGDIAKFNEAWGTTFASFDDVRNATMLMSASREARLDREAFLELVAHRFFGVTTRAIRAVDPNHLILGARFVSVYTPRIVVAVSGRYVDVVSVNAYHFLGDIQQLFDPNTHGNVELATGQFLEGFYAISGRPLLVSEFGYRAITQANASDTPPLFPRLADQDERATYFESYIARCMSTPYVVGFHLYQYMDQPSGGRFDGENNNWGLVDIHDEPYSAVVDRFASIPSP